MEAKLLKYTVSEDRHNMWSTWKMDDGTLESWIHWKFEADDEWVQHCLEVNQKEFSKTTMEEGQANKARIIGPFCIYRSFGPPTWWYPRLKFFKWGIGIGWYHAFIAIGLKGHK